MGTLTNEGATPLLDDGICEVVHQAAGLAEAPPFGGEVVQEVLVQEDLLIPFCHQGTELGDCSNVFTGFLLAVAVKTEDTFLQTVQSHEADVFKHVQTGVAL